VLQKITLMIQVILHRPQKFILKQYLSMPWHYKNYKLQMSPKAEVQSVQNSCS